MAQSSLTPVHSSGLLERDFGNPFLRLHRELNSRALLGSVEATFEQDGRPGPSDEIADAVRRVAALSSREHDVLRLRLRDLSGQVVFSDDGSGFGEKPDPDALRAVRRDVDQPADPRHVRRLGDGPEAQLGRSGKPERLRERS